MTSEQIRNIKLPPPYKDGEEGQSPNMVEYTNMTLAKEQCIQLATLNERLAEVAARFGVKLG